MKDYIVRGLSHIGIRSEDPEGSCRFYIENLGFRPYNQAVMPNGTELWFVENGGMVLEFVKKGVPAPAANGGAIHIAIDVCGMEALVAELKAKGVVPQDAEIKYADCICPSGSKNFFLDGPNGESVELFEMAR